MKTLAFALLLSALSYGQVTGQTPVPVQVTPGTPAIKVPPEPPPPPTPPPPVSPDTIVAEVNGKKYTAAEVDKLIAMLPAQYQQAARTQPQARSQMLSQIVLMQRLAEDAAKAGVDQQSPYKEQLEMQRIQLLSTAELSNVTNTMQISEEDQRKYYNANPDRFKEVKVKVIYIAFYPTSAKAPADGKKLLTEAEAKAKIEDLAKQIQGGADFGKLARDTSDDQASAAKDGDFGVIRLDSPYPETIKKAVFTLKQGEVSAAIREANGFYLIRAEELNHQGFQDAILQIIQLVRQERYQEWLKGMQAQYKVKIENPAYFTPRLPAELQQVH